MPRTENRLSNKLKPQNFWQKADQFSPALCRLLAKHTGQNGRGLGPPLTNAEIASKTGLSEFQILTISQQLNWQGIDLPTMKKFILACGVDFEDPKQLKRAVQYMRGEIIQGVRVPPRFTYLRRSADWKSFYEPLAKKLISSSKHNATL